MPFGDPRVCNCTSGKDGVCCQDAHYYPQYPTTPAAQPTTTPYTYQIPSVWVNPYAALEERLIDLEKKLDQILAKLGG